MASPSYRPRTKTAGSPTKKSAKRGLPRWAGILAVLTVVLTLVVQYLETIKVSPSAQPSSYSC